MASRGLPGLAGGGSSLSMGHKQLATGTEMMPSRQAVQGFGQNPARQNINDYSKGVSTLTPTNVLTRVGNPAG